MCVDQKLHMRAQTAALSTFKFEIRVAIFVLHRRLQDSRTGGN